jgi:predicted metal-dependent peptidase
MTNTNIDSENVTEQVEKSTSKDKNSTLNEKFEGKQTKGAVYRSNEFDQSFIKVYTDNPFLGVISMAITKLADEGVPTAYMGARKLNNEYDLTLGYNPNFFRSLQPNEREGVIVHELYHMIFRHITTRTMADPEQNALWNVATDLAINSIIGKKNLPGFCLFPGVRPTRKDPKTGQIVDAGAKDICDFIERAPQLQASDYYMESMREIISQRKDDDGDDDPTGGLNTLDDHSGWGDMPSEVEEELNEKMRDLLEKAVRHAQNTSNSWGNIPHEIQEQLRALLGREIDWRSVIKNFAGRCRSMERTSSLMKLNKFMPYKFPGARRKTHANFACFIDQSGSMSDEDICMLFTELEGLAKETTIDVFHFDTEVDKK